MQTKIIAHRGASKVAPENTLYAFQLAYEYGADGIETDVHLTKDRVPVLIHDEHVKRTSDGFGFIKDLTWKELKSFDFGSWFSDSYADAKIMSLEELLHWIRNRELFLNIELKNNKIDYPHLEEIVCDMIMHYELKQRTTLSSFNAKSIARLQKRTDAIEVAFLTSKSKFVGLASYAKAIGAQALHVKYRLLNKRLVKQCNALQLPIRVYTVNKFAHMHKCFLLECDGLFTDIPKQAVQCRNSYTR
ncbi:glycerophosphodiester phosphodiesterase [Virgibacillus sp. W0430]|uniref:glycerophosphodiester phosphodiesterase n=1 Tax=Virgibacillus sp. W0430 TaxID=3391580 RepID=UPI003F46089C